MSGEETKKGALGTLVQRDAQCCWGVSLGIDVRGEGTGKRVVGEEHLMHTVCGPFISRTLLQQP